ncbi:MAG: hypothetical protein A2Y62_19455 [Candidatus Fischerbacteria bacterium RBG_13_37_8]|uniref:Radical SAM core domain-containing protein n=1 Tax=Candidatus Fischerbacteria bacterium RBG_13_37_8 TaxID=1817863 RepID=A0A1F5VN41_9BACT|nr:MAG: hypothetical protein A2Y62_19455 [Candidatus Fischerbacteria bacterium RBG_13_37_8]
MDLSNLKWIDAFIASIKEYVYLRKEEKLLILLPNQAYQLNDTAVELLSYLFQGNSIISLSESITLSEEKINDIYAFMCDLRAMVMGCFRESEQRKAVEYIPYKRYFYTYPILSELALTHACNASCTFCYVNCSMASSSEITTGEAKKLLHKIKYEAKVPSVSFTGGEPTLRNDLFELIRFARDTGLRVNLITNGLLIDEKYAFALKEAGLNSAQVSLESADEIIHESLTQRKGSFQKTVQALHALKNAGIHTHTNSTINQLNKQSLLQMIDLAAELQLKRLSMNLLMPCGSADERQELWLSYTEIGDIVLKLRNHAREKGVEFMWYSPTPYCVFNPLQYGLGNKSCAAAHGLLSIDPCGNIMPCSSLNNPIGNMLEKPFDEIWFSEKARYYRELQFAPKICQSCSMLEICGSACPIYFEKMGYSELCNTLPDSSCYVSEK